MRGFVAELVQQAAKAGPSTGFPSEGSHSHGRILQQAAKAVESDAGSASDIAHLAPREYRLSLVASFAYKLLLSVQGPPLPPRLASAVAGSLAAAADRPTSRAALSRGMASQ